MPDVDAMLAKGAVDDLARRLVRLEGDEALAFDIGKCDRRPARERMPRMADHDEPVIEEWQDAQALFLDGVTDQADVDLVIANGAVKFPRPPVFEANLDARVRSPECADVRRQLVQSNGIDDPDAELAFDDVREQFEPFPKLLVNIDDLPAGAKKGLALGRQRKRASAPLDQADLETLLQCANLLRDRALGDSVGHRGAEKLPLSARSRKILNVSICIRKDYSKRVRANPPPMKPAARIHKPFNAGCNLALKTTMSTTIEERLAEVRDRMAEAARKAGRKPEETQLVAVTKTHPPESLPGGARRGAESIRRKPCAGGPGKDSAGFLAGSLAPDRSLQKNKIRQALPIFEMLQASTPWRVARDIKGSPDEEGHRPRVLLEVNVAGEASKFGFKPARLEAQMETLIARCRGWTSGA